MRLSHEELVFLNKFSYTVLEMRDKYSDLDAVEDPLTIAFVDYLANGETFRETKRIYMMRSIPFNKKKILDCIDYGQTLDGKSHKMDLHLVYTCKIVRKFGDKFKRLYDSIWRYNDDHGEKSQDDFLEAALQYYGVKNAFTSTQFYDPLYDKQNEIMEKKRRAKIAEMLVAYDSGVDISSYEDDD